ncbi:MAG: hypothetical protein ACI4LH_05040 [Candidatus Heritagella sp.]
MDAVKTVVVGAASITWMPTFLNDLSRCEAMRGGELVFHDIDKEGVRKMAAFGQRLLEERNFSMKITIEDDLDRSLENADFVVCTVLIGSHDGWKKEMDTIIRHGVHHPKGMSVGPGGIGMGLKQIPWIVGLAKKMEKICPKAWLLNFSNPMQSIMYAVQKYSKIKAIGLCHGVTCTVERMAMKIGEKEPDLFYTIGGVNHFEIITKLTKNEEDLMPRIADAHETIQREKGRSNEIITTELYRLFGGFPCNEDIHSIEFLPYYIHKDTRLEDYEQTQNYIENRMKLREGDWEKVDRFIAGEISIEQVTGNNSEKLAEIIEGISSNKPTYLYANVMNNGYVQNLDRDMCVEVPLVLFKDGYIGCNIGEIPRPFAVLSNVHGAVQHYTVEAAMTGSRKDALIAMSLDPMCYTLTLEERQKLLDDILLADREWIPDYWTFEEDASCR